MTARIVAVSFRALVINAAAPAIGLSAEPAEPPLTPQELAIEAAKQSLADAVGRYFDSGIWFENPITVGDILGDNEPQACEEHCSPPSNSKQLSL